MTEDQYSRRGDKIDSKWKINSWRIGTGGPEKAEAVRSTCRKRHNKEKVGVCAGPTVDGIMENHCTRSGEKTINANLLRQRRRGQHKPAEPRATPISQNLLYSNLTRLQKMSSFVRSVDSHKNLVLFSEA